MFGIHQAEMQIYCRPLTTPSPSFKPEATSEYLDTNAFDSRQDILEGGNLRNALQELQQIIITPIKAQSLPGAAQILPDAAISPSDVTKSAANKDPASEGFQSHNPPTCDGDSTATPISDGDIAGQFTRVMGKGESTTWVGC